MKVCPACQLGRHTFCDEWSCRCELCNGTVVDRVRGVFMRATVLSLDFLEPTKRIRKLRSELDELEAALATGDRTKIVDELGDVFMCVCACAFAYHVEPLDALRGAANKVARRLDHVAHELAVHDRIHGHTMWEGRPALARTLWTEAKTTERP